MGPALCPCSAEFLVWPTWLDCPATVYCPPRLVLHSRLDKHAAGIIMTTRIWRHTIFGNPIMAWLTRVFGFFLLKDIPQAGTPSVSCLLR